MPFAIRETCGPANKEKRECAEAMGCGRKWIRYFGDSQWASRSVLKDFTEGALTILADSLFLNGSQLRFTEQRR